MTDSNRVRVALVKESTLGATPGSARMRTTRDTGEGLTWSPSFFQSQERRADRMMADPSKIGEDLGGTLNWEQSYPASLSAQSVLMECAALAAWTLTPERDNDGTADSVITDIQTVANTITFTTGAAFVVGHLIQTSGFTTAANNGVFKVTTGGTTSLQTTGAGWSAEAAPPATARVKVVGIEGASGDIVATSTGLTSTTMNFVTMGIIPGMWLKLGGTAAGNRFTGTAANNGWARAVTVSANAITLDNRPSGWAADTASGKTIRIFFGDVLRNGTTIVSASIERAFLAQTVPTYIIHRGMMVDQMTTEFSTGNGVTGSFTFLGMSGAEGGSAYGTTYAAAPTGTVMTSNASVGDLRVGGASAASPNWVQSLRLNLANNLRAKGAVGSISPVDIGLGQNVVTGELATYFGSDALLSVAMSGAVSNVSVRASINSQALIQTVPRITFTGANANAQAINSDVILNLPFTASLDPTTNCHFQWDRVEYFET